MVKACDPLNLVPPTPLQLGDDPVPDPCVEGGGVPTQALDLAHVYSHGHQLLVDLVGDLLWRHFGIQDMLLKEGILPVHVRTVEQPISVHYFVPVVLRYVVLKLVFLVLDVVLVGPNWSLFLLLCSR